MVRPVQPSISAPSMPFQPTTVNPIYQDQFGISTLTHADAIRKPLIVLGFFAVVAVLIILWRKLSSTEPTDIPAWVESNCAKLDLKHRQKATLVILQIREFQRTGIINVKAAMNELCQKTYPCPCSVCNQCNQTKAHILRYFEKNKVALPSVGNMTSETELRKSLNTRWPDLSEDSIKLAIERIHAMESDPEFNNTKDYVLFRIRRWGNLEIDGYVVSKPV